MSDQQKQGQQRPTTETFYVVGPGSITRGKTQVKPGQTIELTADEANELGGLVAKGSQAVTLVDHSRRQAGKYRVVGPGTVWAQGKECAVGEVIELSALDARQLAGTVEQA